MEIRVTKLEPPDCHHLNAAEGWLGLGDHLEANEELEKIAPRLRIHPSVLEVRWRIYAKAHNWEACVGIGEALVKLAPDLPESWIHRSYALHELNRTQEAEDKLEAAADLFPSVWTIPYNLACYACQLGKHDEAREWLKDAFELAEDQKRIRMMALEDADLKLLWVEIGNT